MRKTIFYISLVLTVIACKKEKIATENFDLKNYVVHSLYQENNGNGINYKAKQQLLLSFENNQTNMTHVGATNTTTLPTNKISFTLFDGLFITSDSLLVSIDTIRKIVDAGGKYGRTRQTIETNLIDIREKNWDLNNLKLSGKVEMRNSAGDLIQNPTSYIVFNNDASKLNMQETAPIGNINYANTVYFGMSTNYYREANRGDANYQQRLFLVFLKQKVIITGFYADYITNNTFYYFGELNKL